jgi:hypothetical protein
MLDFDAVCTLTYPFLCRLRMRVLDFATNKITKLVQDDRTTGHTINDMRTNECGLVLK